MKTPRHAFVDLDGMRGLAALVVLGRHVPDPTFKSLFPGGYLAVDFFFVLSGFVLAHAYQCRLHDGMSARRFMALRYIRILPQYSLATALSAGMVGLTLIAGHSEATPLQWALACVFAAVLLPLPAGLWPGGTALFPLNLPAWSLFFELAGNALYSLGGYRLSGRWLSAALVAAGVVLACSAASHGGLDGGGGWSTFQVGIARILFGYIAGVVVARCWTDGYRFAHVPRLLAPCLLLALFAIPGWSAPQRTTIDLLVILAFPMIVLLGAQESSSRAGERVMLALGACSYGIYVLHMPLIGGIEIGLRDLLDLSLANAGLIGSIMIIIATVVIALFVERYIDRPLRGHLRQQTSIRSAIK